jgi:hypothetical protein
VCGLFLFGACTDVQRNAQLREVAHLQKQLGTAADFKNLASTDSLQALQFRANEATLRIKQYMRQDTIALRSAQQLDSFKRLSRTFKPLFKQYSQLMTGIKEEKRVLKNLQKDIENGQGDRDQYTSYIAFERTKVGQIKELKQEYLRVKTQVFNDYAVLYPPIALFAQQLLEKAQPRP